MYKDWMAWPPALGWEENSESNKMRYNIYMAMQDLKNDEYGPILARMVKELW